MLALFPLLSLCQITHAFSLLLQNPYVIDSSINQHVQMVINKSDHHMDWSFFPCVNVGLRYVKMRPYVSSIYMHSDPFNLYLESISEWRDHLMRSLYAIYNQSGDIAFKVFKDWVLINDSYLWIDAQISFKKTKNALTKIDVIYSFIGIKNAVHFEQLKQIQSRGYHLEIAYNDSRHQNMSLSLQKNPKYASHDFMIIDNAQVAPTHCNNRVIWNDMARFSYLSCDSFKRLVSNRRLDLAIDKIVKLTKVVLAEYLSQVPINILNDIKNWVWSFDWNPVHTEQRTEFKFFKNNQNDYVWLMAKYRTNKRGCSCCFGLCAMHDLEIVIDCYQFKPSNHFAMEVIDKLEQLQTEQEISEILKRMKQHIMFLRKYDTVYL